MGEADNIVGKLQTIESPLITSSHGGDNEQESPGVRSGFTGPTLVFPSHCAKQSLAYTIPLHAQTGA